jgi:exopolysaccharide biosynthesis polyprenyl glycosylphosphotransferase
MIAPRTRGLIYLQTFVDAVITVSFFWVGLLLFFMAHPGNPLFYPEYLDRYLVYSLLAFGAVMFHGARSIYQNPRWGMASLKDSHNISLAQVLNVLAVLSFFLVATKDKAISRIFLFTWLGTLYFVLLAANRFLPKKILDSFFKDRPERAIFVGPPHPPFALEGWIELQKSMGMTFIQLKPDFSIGALAHLEQLIHDNRVTRVILTEIPETKYNLHYIVDLCEQLGVRLLVLNNLEQLFRHKVTVIEDNGLDFVGLRNEPLESPHNRVMKRLLDLCIATPVVLFVLPPLSLVVWFLQRTQSPGPIFFKQARAGLQNETFLMWKYRSMHMDQADEARQATTGDSRIFPAGRWLRKTSIDELPQFINVLKGNMSVVGPRPHLVKHNEDFARVMRTYYVRSMVKPGITGLAQVRGYRGETKREEDIIKRVESDISYLETWSFGLDIVIIARTFYQMFVPPKTAV